MSTARRVIYNALITVYKFKICDHGFSIVSIKISWQNHENYEENGLFRVLVNVSDRPGTFVFLTWVSIGYPTQSGNCSSDKK